ncbi:hypothetical protein HOG17_04140 [Candidatus Peregrinibacteria bacterium]|nr:hypothetical protein [Candidatus Peregrinibacteria bacterium]MBT4147999.1 hypothetical protein [Candidatus Peregrinibacteria bacterium]MBT4456248.1 hypothetical protein [Candidatus Peregrinibacteria bacterium]
MEQSHNEPIKVAIRGAGGLLGHRLLREILNSQPDIDVSAVVLGTDEDSFRRFEIARYGLDEKEKDIKIFIDTSRKNIRKLKGAWGTSFELLPLDQSFGELGKTDAIVDTAILPGKDNLADFYRTYSAKKPIIHQSGTHPLHAPIAPPFEPPGTEDGSLNYRQGNCLVSGVAPILNAVRSKITDIRLGLVVQRQTRLNAYTLRDNLADTIMDPTLEEYVKETVSGLLPSLDKDNIEARVFQVPGLDYYLCTFEFNLSESVSRDQFLEILRNQPRIKFAPASIPISTGQLEQKLREQCISLNIPLQPIVCFTCPGGIEVEGQKVVVRAAFYSKLITMIPNIDSIRALVRGISMEESMKQTDENIGYKK